MKDEIKEILEKLYYHVNYGIEHTYCEDLITTGELQTLLDYITNLQKTIDFVIDQDTKHMNRIDKAREILKDTSVDMPETLLIETIDYARHILIGGDEK